MKARTLLVSANLGGGGVYEVDLKTDSVRHVIKQFVYGISIHDDILFCSGRQGPYMYRIKPGGSYEMIGDKLSKKNPDLPSWEWGTHDIQYFDGYLYAVASKKDCVYKIDIESRKAEEFLRVFPPTKNEQGACHLNSIHIVSLNEIYMSMFGYDPDVDDWNRWRTGKSGQVWEYCNGNFIVRYKGLDQPHTVQKHDDGLYFCESQARYLCRDGKRLFRIKGYTRGLAIDDDNYYVGRSTSQLHRSIIDPLKVPDSGIFVVSKDDYSKRRLITLGGVTDMYDIKVLQWD